MAQKRLAKEFEKLNKEPVADVVAELRGDNLMDWQITIKGPSASPYKGGAFKVKMEFPTDFPFVAPKLKFQTKIYHPNIDEDGGVCLAILKSENWKPSRTVQEVLTDLVNLLITPMPDDALIAEIGELYKSDIKKYEANAREATKKFASA